jgi:type II secretory pathway predicted ATPase ExeA
MYESFYSFTQKPFSLLPDPHYLFLSSKHKKALARLDHGFTDQSGFIIVTGDVGTGKTTLLKHMVRNLDARIQTAMIFNTQVNSFELLLMILREFDLADNQRHRAECYEALYDFFLEQYGWGNQCLIMIDEAQHLTAQTLEEIRMLSNLNEGNQKLFQVILAGQPSLKIKLERKHMKQFAQRVGIDFVLEPLDSSEIRGYICHRMKKAGRERDEELFASRAHARIYELTRGVPRLINILCDRALVYGFSGRLQEIDVNIIDRVLIEKNIKSRLHGSQPTHAVSEKAPATHPIVQKINTLCKRMLLLEEQFKKFQDNGNNRTIQKFEKLLTDETEKARQTIRESGQKDAVIKSLRHEIEHLKKRLRTQWQNRGKHRAEGP